jgi:hypothetical protein
VQQVVRGQILMARDLEQITVGTLRYFWGLQDEPE